MRRFSVLAVVAACVVCLGGCSGDGSDSEEADVLQVVEEFTAAVNVYDTEAVREIVTEDFTWQSTGPVQSLDEYTAYVDANYKSVNFHVEVTDEPVVHADGDDYTVEESDVMTANSLDPGGLAGTLVYRVVEVEGDWLISEARWTENDVS